MKESYGEGLAPAHIPHAIELYHAAHGFVVPDLPVYEKDAAERHW